MLSSLQSQNWKENRFINPTNTPWNKIGVEMSPNRGRLPDNLNRNNLET